MYAGIGTILELFNWVGFGIGAILLIGYLIARAARAGWVETDAVVVAEGAELRLRWLSKDRELFERLVEPDERSTIGDKDHCEIRYSRFSPWKSRLKADSRAVRALGILTLVFLGIGFIASVASIVLLFLGG
ncbi:MAG: hypothetical protein LH471_00990 [Salinibacterium sp.]|nr:hypothetical protein [Salinibacterium sp.]